MDHANDDDAALSCAICLDNWEPAMTMLWCGHTFHEQCIERVRTGSKKCPICRSLPEKDKPEKMTLKLSRTPKSIGEQLFPTGPPSLAKLRAQTVALVDEDAALRAQLQELVAEEDVLKVQETVLKVDAARSEVDLRRKLREEHDKLIRMRDELAAEAVSLQAELESVKARCEKSLRDRTNKRNDFYRDVEKRAKYEARTRRLQRQIVELRGTAPSSSDPPKRHRTPSPPAVLTTKRAKSARGSTARLEPAASAPPAAGSLERDRGPRALEARPSRAASSLATTDPLPPLPPPPPRTCAATTGGRPGSTPRGVSLVLEFEDDEESGAGSSHGRLPTRSTISVSLSSLSFPQRQRPAGEPVVPPWSRAPVVPRPASAPLFTMANGSPVAAGDSNFIELSSSDTDDGR